MFLIHCKRAFQRAGMHASDIKSRSGQETVRRKSTFCSIFLRVLVSLSGATSQEQPMVLVHVLLIASSVFLDQGGKDHVVA